MSKQPKVVTRQQENSNKRTGNEFTSKRNDNESKGNAKKKLKGYAFTTKRMSTKVKGINAKL